jgi:Outer membrane protein beta-barrel domain
MKDKEFDKLFSDKLNQEGHFPNKDKVKANVFSRLDNELPVAAILPIPDNNTNATGFKTLWALPFLLLLSGWNSCQWFQIKNLKQANTSLQAEVQGLNTAIISLHSDTIIYQSKTIYKIDTIYKTVYIVEKNISTNDFNYTYPTSSTAKSVREKLIATDRASDQTTPKPWETIKNTNTLLKNTNSLEKTTPQSDKMGQTAPKTNNFNTITEKKPLPEKPTNGISPTIKTEELLKKADSTAMTQHDNSQDSLKKTSAKKDSLKKIDLVKAPKPATDSLEEALNKQEKKDEKRVPIIQKLTIKHTYMGLNAGLSTLAPATTDLSTTNWWGANGEWAFNDNWRINLSVDRTYHKFKTTHMPSILNLPEPTAPGSQYAFAYVEGKVVAWQLGIGLNYLFQTQNSIRPLVSLGYMYRLEKPYTAEYEFDNLITKEHASVKMLSTQHNDNWWLIGIGADAPMNPRLSLRLKLDYAYEFSNNSGRAILRGGVMYRF